MSQSTWITYGYGIKTTDIKEISPERMEQLLAYAPNYSRTIHEWFEKNDVFEPTYEDYEEAANETDQTACALGLARILSEVISESEAIDFTACDDEDANCYLLFEPRYPWTTVNVREKNFTENDVNNILKKYTNIITDQIVNIDYEEAVNYG